MSYETLQITRKNMVAYLTLNRPERLNSFDMKLGHELYDALETVAKDSEIRVSCPPRDWERILWWRGCQGNACGDR